MFNNDNRWIQVIDPAPDGTIAAYGARWIDQGDHYGADIVPDRQGFAYNDAADRDRLINLLGIHDARNTVTSMERGDAAVLVIERPDFKFYVRRTGGYFYVEAFLIDDDGDEWTNDRDGLLERIAECEGMIQSLILTDLFPNEDASWGDVADANIDAADGINVLPRSLWPEGLSTDVVGELYEVAAVLVRLRKRDAEFK